jgi:hypothetical protein
MSRLSLSKGNFKKTVESAVRVSPRQPERDLTSLSQRAGRVQWEGISKRSRRNDRGDGDVGSVQSGFLFAQTPAGRPRIACFPQPPPDVQRPWAAPHAQRHPVRGLVPAQPMVRHVKRIFLDFKEFQRDHNAQPAITSRILFTSPLTRSQVCPIQKREQGTREPHPCR